MLMARQSGSQAPGIDAKAIFLPVESI